MQPWGKSVTEKMTKKILDAFTQISQIPRCSKNEAQICAWLVDWAKEHGFEVETDEVENILIRVPASAGYEAAPIVVLQGHVDMVCEKTPESIHDFSKDPIELVYEGEWLSANQTTLGADNGIALAMAMVAATDEELEHPAMELLFTVDEETGLTGANALKPGFLKGKILLNLDSEDEGIFTIGCAGGRDTHLYLPLTYENARENVIFKTLKVGGLKGGHSGVDIAEERGNAIRILARSLWSLYEGFGVRLADIKGGSAHNAIPRDAEAVIEVAADKLAEVEATLKAQEGLIANEFKNTDPNFFMRLEDRQWDQEVMSEASSKRVMDFIMVVPHGVGAMSTAIKDLVETSNNEAVVKVEDKHLVMLTSQRSSVMSRIDVLTQRIEAVAALAGGRAESGNGYPAWQPNMDSELLERCVKLYKEHFGKEPVVEIIHAGLECGIIGSKNEGMDMISFGPTIKDPHSPDERIHIPSIGMVWDFLAALLASYKP